jgi:diguanylate cyclase
MAVSLTPNRMLPRLAHLDRRPRRRLIAVAVLTLAALALNLAHTGLGLGGERWDVPLNAWLQNVVLAGACVLAIARARRPGRDRGGWIALALGICCWSLGNLYWNLALYSAEAPPYPSLADAGWLLFYPAAYACIGLRLRTAARHLPRSLWLDGLLGVLSVSAVGALLINPVLTSAHGSHAAVLVNSAYPVFDLLLCALCFAVCALHGWRPGRDWVALTVGFGIFATADIVYLLRLAAGTYTCGSVLDSAWVVALVVMSLAAWQTATAPNQVEISRRAVLITPFTCSLGALGVLAIAAFAHAPAAAIVLALAALVATMARTALTFGEIGRLAEAEQLAATDELTGLPNRRHFHERLSAALQQARRHDHPLALLLIDLDHFKELNDTLGHHAGDQVLNQVGPRLRAHLREEDELARLGGDEFAVLLPRGKGADTIGERLRGALDEHFTVEGIQVSVGGSIGIVHFPQHGEDPETLLRRADVAMYQAKATQTGHALYAPERDIHSRERLELIAALRDAVGTEQLILHYQPKLDLHTGTIQEVEALVRWQHPTRGLLPPGAFIALAEQAGVMAALTDQVLATALAQVARWHAAGLPLGVAVNVSATTLVDDAWANRVVRLLAANHVPAERLRIEITEDAIMTDPERSLAIIRRLADNGVRVSLDDFGTGYSSLSVLKQLQATELKIDRGFISHALTEPADAAIVQTVIDLGRRLGLSVVAEGVEDQATLDQLIRWGADAAQGYLISRPLPPAELGRWLATAANRPPAPGVTLVAG